MKYILVFIFVLADLLIVLPADIIPTYAHDPFVIKENDTYYFFATGQGITIQRSRDLMNWDYSGSVYPVIPDWMLKEIPGFTGRIWAPEIKFINGKYYLYYSVSTYGSNRSFIGLAVNKTLDPQSSDYKWIDEGKVIESFKKDNWNAIDPNLETDGKGVYYLSFGSFWDGIKMIEINIETGKALKNPPKLFSLARRPGSTAIEAPFILKKNNYFYLFVSFDYCCRGSDSNYKIFAGRSENITGPYYDMKGVDMINGGGTLILENYGQFRGPGHNMIFSENNTDWLVYHAYDSTRGGVSVFQIRKLDWSDDGWPSAGRLKNQ
ncbi:MAG: arabinan endo-1,5-alpha-L-arabinosidase [Spirochaetes bacterium]|nr:arabinan endo-1,5-alpha-L-arabinosidase [Spirochaetota bacterium]